MIICHARANSRSLSYRAEFCSQKFSTIAFLGKLIGVILPLAKPHFRFSTKHFLIAFCTFSSVARQLVPSLTLKKLFDLKSFSLERILNFS
jgi:hypothetical protein